MRRSLRLLITRRPLLPRRVRFGLCTALAAAAVALATIGSAPARPEATASAGLGSGIRLDPQASRGRALYEQGCSDCHGPDARGIAGVAPDLHGVGEQSADFYLRTGRMPLDNPDDQPIRTESPYSDEEIADLVAYVGSLGGPGIPSVDAGRGSVSRGLELFTENCAACHQVVGRGGIVTGAVVPDLQQATPTDVAEAVSIGPYVMPRFPQLTSSEVDDLAAYVGYTRDPEDRGGWGIGHIGPIPEGMVAWLLAGVALLLAIRLIGERTTR